MASTHTRRLAGNYLSFFRDCADITLSPYTATYNFFAGPEDDFIMGLCALIALSTPSFPLLPAASAILFSLVAIAAAFAINLAVILFPLHIVADLVDPSRYRASESQDEVDMQVCRI